MQNLNIVTLSDSVLWTEYGYVGCWTNILTLGSRVYLCRRRVQPRLPSTMQLAHVGADVPIQTNNLPVGVEKARLFLESMPIELRAYVFRHVLSIMCMCYFVCTETASEE